MKVTKEFLFGKSPDVLDDAKTIAVCEIRKAAMKERSRIFVSGTHVPYREEITVTGDENCLEGQGQIEIYRKFTLPKTTEFILLSESVEETKDTLLFRFEVFIHSSVIEGGNTIPPEVFNVECVYSSKMSLVNDIKAFIYFKDEFVRYRDFVKKFYLGGSMIEL